jgi:hypothetical protein
MCFGLPSVSAPSAFSSKYGGTETIARPGDFAA